MGSRSASERVGKPANVARDYVLQRVVQSSTGCWLWQLSLTHDGYAASHWVSGVHRLAYEIWVGQIPDGLELDHLCRVRHCVNPDHLEAVTKHENMLRGQSLPAQNVRKTHCLRGHPFDEKNTRIESDGARVCRRCNLAAVQRLRRRRAGAAA
jgi:hypothetical protein